MDDNRSLIVKRATKSTFTAKETLSFFPEPMKLEKKGKSHHVRPSVRSFSLLLSLRRRNLLALPPVPSLFLGGPNLIFLAARVTQQIARLGLRMRRLVGAVQLREGDVREVLGLQLLWPR